MLSSLQSFGRRSLPVLALLLSACGGDNLFDDPVAGVGPDDSSGPDVAIQMPDTGQRVAVGDSVLVRVRVNDDQGLDSLVFEGFSLRGSAELGTLTRVSRFVPKIVQLDSVQLVRDTIISRYLLASGDSLADDSVIVRVRASDFGGNELADSVRIAIGGPRVQIVSPPDGAGVRAGTDLLVQISAGDPSNRLQTVRLAVTGGVTSETVLRLDPPRAALDTVLRVAIPASATGEAQLRLTGRNSVNDSTTTVPTVLQLLPPTQDTRLPTVRFRVQSPARGERNDTVAVTVVGTDDTRLSQVGVTILPIHRLPTRTDTLTLISLTEARDSTTFRVPLSLFNVPVPTDTSTLRLEVTAFAVDASGNCATATVPNTPLSEACTTSNPVRGPRSGAFFEVLVVRGHTIRLVAGDRIADIAADGSNLFLSNIARNRIEVMPIGATAFTGTVAVGSRPWGLAFNKQRSLLYVANSGGTNISVVSPSSFTEVQRIQTPNVKLFDVPFEAEEIPDPDSPGDSISALFPTAVSRRDYSDRPQFIGVTQNENLVFSTVPTAAAADGTLRIHRTGQDRLEIVTDYAEERVGNRVVIANADSAFLISASPNNLLSVCPRNRSTNAALDRNLPVTCYIGSVDGVQNQIQSIGYDTKFLYAVDINEIGLSDTTFVAVSGDHSTVSFGEGDRDNGRVMAFLDPLGQPNGPFIRFGEIRDLVGNVAQRVIGLALNADGTLGIARGNEAYFYSRELRLQGVIETDPGGGGVEMHPDNPTVRRSFVSGVQADGLAFIDVMDSFHFQRIRRIFIRDPVIGPLRAVRVPGGGLKLYAVTQGGIAAVDINASDL